MINLYLVRHAESEANLNGKLVCGRSSRSPLTSKGINQASLLGKYWKLNDYKFDKIFSSTAQRAIKTAEIVASSIGADENSVMKYESLEEISMGDFEGKLRDEVYDQKFKSIMESDPLEFSAPNGESQRDVEQRVFNFLKHEILDFWDKEKNLNIAIFSHSVTIKCLLRSLHGDFDEINNLNLFNTSVSHIRFSEKMGWEMINVNSFSHLLKK